MKCNTDVIAVDLDGTLIKTDMLYESANQLFFRSPFVFFFTLLVSIRGKSALKTYLAKHYECKISTLPFNTGLLSWLYQQKRQGYRIVLATGTHQLLANQVAQHLGLIDNVFATNIGLNLKAEAKRDFLINEYGERGFDYVGNSSDDLTIWASANRAHIVSTSAVLIYKARKISNVINIFSNERRPLFLSLLKALRLHQSIKNLIIFVPLIAAQQFANPTALWKTCLAFLAFSLIASSIYILNDLADLAHDRNHNSKKFRPFAAGDLSLIMGWFIWPSLFLVAILLSITLLSTSFTVAILGYFTLAIYYSFKLKQIPILDVLTLAGLYTARIIAGAAAIAVPVSYWLLAFSLFFFLSLAFVKRFCELYNARQKGYDGIIDGRGYTHKDLNLVSSMGISAGYLSVLVMALYIQDFHTTTLYKSPEVIWAACPILFYWISRIWFISHRGEMHDDPIIFSIKDRTSWFALFSLVIIFALAALT